MPVRGARRLVSLLPVTPIGPMIIQIPGVVDNFVEMQQATRSTRETRSL